MWKAVFVGSARKLHELEAYPKLFKLHRWETVTARYITEAMIEKPDLLVVWGHEDDFIREYVEIEEKIPTIWVVFSPNDRVPEGVTVLAAPFEEASDLEITGVHLVQRYQRNREERKKRKR